MSALVIDVRGTPAPQGSKTHVGNGVMVESSKKVKPWRADVREAALAALDRTPDWDREHEHVQMVVVFSLKRPRLHYRTGQWRDHLRADAPSLHGTRPDLDKLLRSTCDALSSAGCWVDDNRLCAVYGVKTYTDTAVPGSLEVPGAHIVLTGVKS